MANGKDCGGCSSKHLGTPGCLLYLIKLLEQVLKDIQPLSWKEAYWVKNLSEFLPQLF